ncbi:MAG: winged helix-turn-helix transcriptional regulator [Lachnospiraceae bacterium]|nr:winged helix-turn-helix transcriptional regulator [Lachnospiraceae bacterium]
MLKIDSNCTCNHDLDENKKLDTGEDLTEDLLIDLAELFKVFGDSTRIKILYVLSVSSMCVCDIANKLGMTQSAISHQLRILKQSKLVTAQRDGKSIIYSLADSHVSLILSQGMEHIKE